MIVLIAQDMHEQQGTRMLTQAAVLAWGIMLSTRVLAQAAVLARGITCLAGSGGRPSGSRPLVAKALAFTHQIQETKKERNKRTNKHTNKQTNKQTNKRTNKQKEREKEKTGVFGFSLQADFSIKVSLSGGGFTFWGFFVGVFQFF